MGKSLLGRIDKNKKTLLATKSGPNPSGLQVYKDANHALGILFRMVFGWVGIDIDKYAKAKPHKKGKKNKRSMLGRIGF